MSPITADTASQRLRARAMQIGLSLRRLDARDPASWPLWVQVLLLACLALGVLAGLWIFVLGEASDELASEARREQTLRADFTRKAGQTANLDALRRQRAEVLSQLQVLERQLPGKAEIDALLSDINQAGLTRGLRFELFRPGPVVLQPYFAELPVTLKVTGRYHDLGRFAADIAALPRIVTLHQINVAAGRDGQLTFEAVLRAFRALEPEEIPAKATSPGKPGTPGAGGGPGGKP